MTKVLQLITHFDPGGAQETVLLLASGLQHEGFEVTIAARPGTEVERVPTNVTFEPLPDLHRPISLRRDGRAFAAISALIRRNQYHVVHTHSSKAGVLGRVAARLARVPAIVHTSHGLPVNPDMSRLERTLLTFAERGAARACDNVVAVSDATARELEQLHLARAEQIEVIASGIDVEGLARADRTAARSALGLNEDALVVGWVGRHFEQKRPEQIVAVAHRVLRDVPRAVFVMIGDGPLLERTRTQAAGDPRIQVMGHRADVADLYVAFDVFVLASAWEGLPRTILEALAAGVPVVTTDVSGIREVVRPGVNGFLADVGDVDELARLTSELLQDTRLRTEMAERARAVDHRYTARHTVDATAALYRRLLRASGGRS